MSKTHTEEPEKAKCLTPGCDNKEDTRGQCSRCYAATCRAVKKGETTWEAVVAAGLARPSTWRTAPIHSALDALKSQQEQSPS